jgi:hypothetical protein
MNKIKAAAFAIVPFAIALLGAISLPNLPASAADAPATAPAIPVAHSALLTINATITSDGMALHILHANNQIPIDGRDVTLLVDGKNQLLKVAPETGTFLLPTKDIGEGVKQFDITVAHDGIREILTGKIEVPKTGSVADLWADHKQMAWWVLNIVIVLVAVLAISNRKSKPDKDDDEPDAE